ncbi:hypothetical protein RJ640_025466 [Escallonia rubra]|uniref:Glycerol-3-phosphate dehydrogenase NAD-dependent N-terminal domain-containing protein n=1 Tax=Escallonia rubra TaxID=112253 RepID=A0AA88UG91_9ASTE|nr:hypothetical protein RJ640_025466 [Escallonia rubra]
MAVVERRHVVINEEAWRSVALLRRRKKMNQLRGEIGRKWVPNLLRSLAYLRKMVGSTGSTETLVNNVNSNGSIQNQNGYVEEKIDELRRLFGKADNDPLRIVGVGAGAWGSVFAAMLQDGYGHLREKVQIRLWRRAGRAVDRATAEHLFEVINSREDVLRRLIRRCAYLKYVEARLGDRILYADEILKDGFCLNMIDTPLCPLKVVTNLQEAVWDADVVISGLPSTETREVFEEISRYWKERITAPVIISLAKGIETELEPEPRIITPTQMISRASLSVVSSQAGATSCGLHVQQKVLLADNYSATYSNQRSQMCWYHAGVSLENILYLGGPNIASEIYNKEYANARICGAEKWRKPLAKFLRQPHFIVWDNGDLVTHEVMGGLKNVYAIGAEEPEKLAGPLLADTYVTLLKGRNAWYGQKLAKGELSLDMGDSIKGKGMIQDFEKLGKITATPTQVRKLHPPPPTSGVSAVKAFYDLLSQSRLSILHPEEKNPVAPVELCPILKTLYKILIVREFSSEAILLALRDETLNDPRDRIEIAQSHVFYRPSVLGRQPLSAGTRT